MDLVTMDVGHEGEEGVWEALGASIASSLRSLPETPPRVQWRQGLLRRL